MDAAEKQEIQRKAQITWEFVKCTPEFPQSPDNSYEMMKFINNHGMECSIANFKIAFQELKKQGKIKTPVASPIAWGSTEPDLMPFEEAQKFLDEQDDSEEEVVFAKPLLLPKKATVTWDKEFAKKVLTPKGPVVKEPVIPVVGEKKPRKFKE